MAIDRDALQKQLAENKARRAFGNVQRLKQGVTQLRVLEFVDENGQTQFARAVVQFRLKSDNKKTVLDRLQTFGIACAATRLEEKYAESGTDSPFQRRQTQYYVNAIDVSKKPFTVKRFALPTSVWEAIAAMLVSDDWADVLEPQNGHYFTITRTGEGLSTEYDTVPSRDKWPVSPDLLAQVKDPYVDVGDPGVDGQCKFLGCTIGDLWDDTGELEQIEPMTFGESAPAAAAPAKGGKALPPPTAKPAAAVKPKSAGWSVGDRVTAGDKTGVVSALAGKEVHVTHDDEPDQLYAYAPSDLTAAEEEAPFDVPFPTGTHGMAPFGDTGDKFAGEITGYNGDNQCEITFDDGDTGVCDPGDFEPDDASELVTQEVAPATPKPIAAGKGPKTNLPIPAKGGAVKGGAAKAAAGLFKKK